MQQTKWIFNFWPSTACLAGGLLWLCPLGNLAFGQTNQGQVHDMPASAALENEPVAESESKANQPASIRNDEIESESGIQGEVPTGAAQSDSISSGEILSPVENTKAAVTEPASVHDPVLYERGRGSQRLPPDPRREAASTSAGFNSEEEGGAGSADSLPQLDAPNWLMRTLGGLGVVFALLFLVKPLLRKFAGPLGSARAPSGVLEALARYPFGKGQFLVLIKLDTRILLLCQTSQGSNLITEINDPDEVASLLRRVHDEKGESFNRKLEALLHHDRSDHAGEMTTTSTVSGDDSVAGFNASGLGLVEHANPTNVIDLTGAADAARPRRFRLPSWRGRSGTSASPTMAATTNEVR